MLRYRAFQESLPKETGIFVEKTPRAFPFVALLHLDKDDFRIVLVQRSGSFQVFAYLPAVKRINGRDFLLEMIIDND